ncbi:MAG TPA: outer membrane protein assembly factor BamD [Stellaceae bacterium]|nr:outer membrane protein assembly factor BamD [Stellaceae bacterium]
MPSALALLALTAIALTGCAGKPEDDDSSKPVEVIYNDAMDKMAITDYVTAAQYFDEVDRLYPYSVWATKAELMEIYAQYQANKYDDAIAAANHYIALHPGNRDTAYAYYLKAICYYEQITDIGRDQQTTLDAQNALQAVIDRYPDSEYARDARIKLDLTHDHLAGKEMEIGRFYEGKNLYIAAINRYDHVIANYQNTSHVPEALGRLVESYTALGLPREAKQTAAVLGYNFPYNPWYRDSYNLIQKTQKGQPSQGPELKQPGQPSSSGPGWLSRTWSSIF